MNYSDIYALVGFVLGILGVVLTGRKWTEGRLKEVRDEATTRSDLAQATAALARDDLAQHKLHVAENYVSKEGLREVRDEIMAGVREVSRAVEGVSKRLDGWIDRRP